MNVDVLFRDEADAHLLDAIEATCVRALAALEAREDAELSVLITADDEIRELNRDYRELDEPTDVLSFPLQEGEGAGIHPALGDVVLSLPYAARQAARRGWPLALEIDFLLIHGILHLLGWDHEDPEEARAMEGATAGAWASLHPAVPLPVGFLSGDGGGA